jgi:hypothetical protein
MTVKEVICNADELRPNALEEEIKYGWVWTLDGDVANLMKREHQKNPFPQDTELLMPHPYDEIYIFYLMAMIDTANRDSTLYANDSVMFNSAYGEAKAWWRRNNKPAKNGNWRVM